MRFVCDVRIGLCVCVDDAKKIDIISIQFVSVARNICLMTFYHFCRWSFGGCLFLSLSHFTLSFTATE